MEKKRRINNYLFFLFHIKVFMMRIKLVLAALLFLLPSNICGSKEDQNSNVESKNLANIDVSDGLVTDHDKTSRPAVKTVARREAAELTDDI